MKRFGFLILILLLSSTTFAQVLPSRSIPNRVAVDPFGVILVIDNADEFDFDFMTLLSPAIPPEWLPPTDGSGRYEAHVLISVQTQACRYINNPTIRLQMYDIDVTLVDTVTGETWAPQRFEHEALYCPATSGQGTVSYPNNDAVQAWLVEKLSGEGTLPAPFVAEHIFQQYDFIKIAHFSPDGEHLLTLTFDGAHVWNAATGAEELLVDGEASNVVYSPNGKYLGIIAQSSSRVVDASTGSVVLTLLGVSQFVFSPDGLHIVTANDDDLQIHLLEVESGEEIWHYGEMLMSPNVVFSPGGRYLLVATPETHVLDTATGTEIFTVSDWGYSVAFSPDERLLAILGFNNQDVPVYDLTTGQLAFSLSGHTATVKAVAFSPDGRRLATTAEDNTMRLWDAATGQELHRFEFENIPVFMTFSPDGRFLSASVTWGQVGFVWDTESYEQVLQLNGHAEQLLTIEFSADGQQILTSSTDMTVRLWNIAQLYTDQ